MQNADYRVMPSAHLYWYRQAEVSMAPKKAGGEAVVGLGEDVKQDLTVRMNEAAAVLAEPK